MPNAEKTLPAKEHAQFKKILTCYEQKKYKAGLKAAKYILSQEQFKNHGETLALKGLVLNCMDRKKEAYEHVKKGLMNDMSSHVCWHVFGLLYRSDKDYLQSSKCYRSALRYDKDNTQIMRDLSLLQVQMRDLEGYKETRHQLLISRPSQRASWLGYAIALHLKEEYADAAKVLTRYEATQVQTGESDLKKRDYEAGELVMYKAKIMFDDKKYEEALAYLAEHEVQICDERALRQMQANLLVEMNELSRAEALYRRMLDENRENHNLYAGLERCLGMTDATPEADRLAVYTEYRTKFPKAHAPQLLPLFFTTGATFEKLLDEYLRFAIRKGMCPMFRNIRQVYSDPAKVGIVEKLANSYLASLTAGNKFDAAGEVQPPTCFVWASYFAAQHFDKTGDHVKAMEVIDAAIAHTPTVLELYMAKAKILKHAGNLTDAAHWLNYARELDTADRYINSKSVKYMLRANEVDKAATTVALFTREATDPMEHLSEMQAFWFETEQAKAFARMGNVGKALKKIKTIEGHFSQMVEDQFDFHTYCIRKMTLRAYHGLMNMEDNIRGHRFYVSAAVVGIDCYLGLHDKPYGSKEREESEAASAGMTPAERKKMLSKQKKAAKKAAADAAAASAAKDGKGKKAVVKSEDDEDKKGKADEDPMGELLMKTTEPLEEALKLLKPLMLLAPNRIESHLAAFEVYVRKGKVLLMLRSLKRAQKIDPNHPDVHRAQVQCLVKSKELAATTHPKVQAVLDAELPAVLSGVMDAEKLISAYSAANPKSLPALLAVAEMTALVTPAKMGDAAAGLAVADLAALDGVTLPVCRAVHACLAQKFKDAAGATKFLASSKVQFSLATW